MYETTPLKDLQAELGETAETGLSENEAKTRLEKYGRNTLAKTKRKSVFMHILCSFKDVTIIILCVAMALSLYIALTTHPDNLTEPIVIAFIIVLNIFLSVREQVKAEKSVESLKKYNIQKCTVIRAGKTDKIDAELLVPGLRATAFPPTPAFWKRRDFAVTNRSSPARANRPQRTFHSCPKRILPPQTASIWCFQARLSSLVNAEPL